MALLRHMSCSSHLTLEPLVISSDRIILPLCMTHLEVLRLKKVCLKSFSLHGGLNRLHLVLDRDRLQEVPAGY